MSTNGHLRLPAIEIQQGDHRLYAFGVDGKLVPRFAAVSRIHRGDGGSVLGYQRTEVLSHINEIQRYLESDAPMIPNAVVVALDNRVRFSASSDNFGSARAGELIIPLDETWSESEKPGWVVDGQQRLAAIRNSQLEAFHVFAVAFLAESQAQQREQFILVNSTKPLAKGLIYELLPQTEGHLPQALKARRLPARLLARLNADADSPMRGMIRTPTTPNGVIKDNSVLRMIENSLTDGSLYRARGAPEAQVDLDSMLRPIKAYWAAVSSVFEKSWALPPSRSRLMHGAGIVSMGFLMDAISDRRRSETPLSPDQFGEDLAAIAPSCRWSEGFWDLGPGQQRKWNEIQNTGRDVQLVTNYLLVIYKQAVWGRTRGNS